MTDTSPARVLIVDDQPENLLAVVAVLDQLGLECVTAASGREALRLLLEGDFAVILLDVRMPDLNGFETAQLIRERGRSHHTPIIFLTAAFTTPQDAVQGYALGAVDYIVKPCEPEILKSKVLVFVDLWRKTEEVKEAAERLKRAEQREYEARLLAVQKQMEFANTRMRDEHRVTQAILKNAPMGICRTDKDFIVQEINEVFAQQFGKEALIVGASAFNALPSLPAETFLSALSRGEPFAQEEFSNDGGKTTSKYFSLAAWPMQGEDSQLVGAIIMVVDVTEKMRLNQQREDFLATLAHDLQTPAVASERAAELLRKSVGSSLTETQLKFLELLEQNTHEMLDMIRELLELYRFEAGVQPFYMAELDLALNAANCIETQRHVAAKHGVNIEFSSEPDLPEAYADRTAMRRVIHNLIDNAIKFSSEGGVVNVVLTHENDDVVLRVDNTGPKIEPEHLPHIFDRYWNRYQAGQQARKRASCGLGLYVCMQIVTAHNGRISCDSSDKITTFTVRLPRSRKALELRREEKPGAPLKRSRRKATHDLPKQSDDLTGRGSPVH